MANILLVDDDKNSINLYKSLLEKEGHEIDTAYDGEEGLEKIKKGKYDLILLDVMLPKIDGITVLSDLNKELPQVERKIVLLSNLSHNPALDEAKKLGAYDHIDKAMINPDQFIEKIKSYHRCKKTIQVFAVFFRLKEAFQLAFKSMKYSLYLPATNSDSTGTSHISFKSFTRRLKSPIP